MNMKTMRDTTAILASVVAASVLFSGCASKPVPSDPVGPPWTGETFLPAKTYAQLKPGVEKSGATTYDYREPNFANDAARYTNIMVDQPAIFISENSPYKGAKPADLVAIAEFARSTYIKHLQAHGYTITETKGPDVLYIRSAIAHLELQEKPRSILEYTPEGFVVGSVVRALEDTMQKMDILQVEVQIEVLDAQSGKQLGAGVTPRGGDRKRMTFHQFQAIVDLYGERFACRLDNARVPAAQVIDCTDADAIKARPKVL